MDHVKQFYSPCEKCNGVRNLYLYPDGTRQLTFSENCKDQKICEEEMLDAMQGVPEITRDED